MKKNDKPSELFIAAIMHGYKKASEQREIVTCADIWNQVVMECLRMPDGFTKMFEWDTSKAQIINRIGTIQECIGRGYVPRLRLLAAGRRLIVIQNDVEL